MRIVASRWTRAVVRALPLIGMVMPAAVAGGQALAAAGADMPSPYAYWATVDNPFPAPGSGRTLMMTAHFTNNGVGVRSVPMASIWRDGQHRIFCYAMTDADGTATCKRLLPGLRLGSALEINITFTYQGKTYSTTTSALPL